MARIDCTYAYTPMYIYICLNIYRRSNTTWINHTWLEQYMVRFGVLSDSQFEKYMVLYYNYIK